MEGAAEWMEKNLTEGEASYQEKFNSYTVSLLLIHDKKNLPLFSVDSTAGRLHTNLTNLKSDLRNYLTYDGKTLVAVDIRNSQPYLSLALFRKDSYCRESIIG